MLVCSVLSIGSSPRTRGTLAVRYCGQDVDRFIPAHAGNTPLTTPRSSPPTVHPRARGEHTSPVSSSMYSIGSSPRTRGTHFVVVENGAPGRFIPAHAGNTPVTHKCSDKDPVHPRARGEHSSDDALSAVRPGSSPRTRGTRGAARGKCAGVRFIPAHAGNTSSVTSIRRKLTVHPRARGEHAAFITAHVRMVGSSPRTRGTPVAATLVHELCRFIPAHAGNTTACWSPAPPSPVHPRARGEHSAGEGLRLARVGSSPRTRGTHPREHSARYERRFIPAHAGNTSPPRRRPKGRPVHPRARGEHHDRARWADREVRFIPAHAGNT